MCISDHIQTTFFYLERFVKKLADDRWSSITKGSIYHLKHKSIQPFNMGVDGCFMEVSIMFNIFTYCILTLYDRLGIVILYGDMLCQVRDELLWPTLILDHRPICWFWDFGIIQKYFLFRSILFFWDFV